MNIPHMLSFGEGSGTVQVCATLLLAEDTQLNFTAVLQAVSGQGIGAHKKTFYSHNHCVC